MYRPRFITEEQLTEAVNLYHLARTALAATADQSKHARKVWAARELAKKYGLPHSAGAYKDLCGALEA